jgi:hypothetical protein
MKPILPNFAEHIEQEGLDCVVHILVIKEHTRDQTQVLTVHTLKSAVHFKESDIIVSVNFIAWRMAHRTLARVPQELLLVDAEEETKITNVKALRLILFRQRRKVPCLKPMLPKLNTLHSLKLCLIYKLLHLFLRHSVIFIIEEELLPIQIVFVCLLFLVLIDLGLLPVNLFLINFEELLSDPSIITTIDAHVVNIVLVTHTVEHLLLFRAHQSCLAILFIS